MQFLVTLTLDQLTESPTELQSAMTDFVEDELRTGSFVLTGGLASPAEGVRIELSPSGLSEEAAQLPVHGFAVVEAASLEQAVAVASGMLQLHRDHVPDWSGHCEVRAVVTHCLP